MKITFNDFINESVNNEISPELLNEFKKQLSNLKLDNYLQTIIGFYPIITIERKMRGYDLCIWYKKDDVFLEEPRYCQFFQLEQIENTLQYIKEFLHEKRSLDELMSSFAEMGNR
jgi:hypothetical protein